MCQGRILTDSAQDKNVQIDAKLNATEQDNTYPSSENNAQQLTKKMKFKSKVGLRMSKHLPVTIFWQEYVFPKRG